MTSPATLGADDLRAVWGASAMRSASHQADINRLNVYPVPDGDTGTNMALTLEAVVAELEGVDSGSGAGRGLPGHRPRLAHGRPGQLGRDPVPAPAGHERADGAAPETTGVGPETCWPRRSRTPRTWPARPWCGRSRAPSSPWPRPRPRAPPGGSGDSWAWSRAPGSEAAEALARTPELLPVLAQAGVVDAGGSRLPAPARRLLLVARRPPAARARGRTEAPDLSLLDGAAAPAAPTELGARRGRCTTVGDLRYEVMYLLGAPDDSIAGFKEVWAGIGDSIVVVGGDGLWNCHIHTDDIGGGHRGRRSTPGGRSGSG